MKPSDTKDTVKQESQWQEKITGEWYGCPSVFDADGKHLGYNKVNRSSVVANGQTTYFMKTELDVTGDLRARFEAPGFAFGVLDNGKDRIYMGPDFYGCGNPYGSLVDAHYYSPGWSADLRTLVHILPDGKTQVYSSQLFEGPKLISVFNGLYLMATDYADNPDTKARIDAFVALDRKQGNRPHVLPMKESGEWRGEFQVYDDHQKLLGVSFVRLQYRPLDLRRAEVKFSIEGAVNLQATYVRAREGFRHDFHGPDLYGNAVSYGRALYTSVHMRGQALKLKGRDFLIDEKFTTSSAWQLFAGDRQTNTLYGVLHWTEADKVLTAQY
jgi:hypothetical protein